MLKNLLASVGIGAAALTLRLESVVRPRGGDIQGCFVLEGGDVAQYIESIVAQFVEDGSSTLD